MDARRLSEWLIGEALSGSGDFALFHGYCERLVAAGVPLFRGFMASDVLHPTVESRAVRWQRGTDTVSAAPPSVGLAPPTMRSAG